MWAQRRRERWDEMREKHGSWRTIYTHYCWEAVVWHRDLSSVLCDELETWGAGRGWVGGRLKRKEIQIYL